MRKIGFILSVAVLLFCGCQPKQDSPVRMVSHTYTLHTNDTISELSPSTLHMDFKVEWPCREDSAIEAIRQSVLNSVFGPYAPGHTIEDVLLLFADTIREEYRSELAADEEEGYINEEGSRTEYIMRLSIDDPCECFLNFELYCEENNNQAPHGTHSTYYYCYDRRTGQNITEDQLFKGDYKEELTKLITEAIWRSYRTRGAVRSLEFVGLDVEEAEPNENFYISGDCITYYYQENELGCYAAGPQTAVVQLEDMREYLRDTTIIHHHE